jgi:hypothetical protein
MTERQWATCIACGWNGLIDIDIITCPRCGYMVSMGFDIYDKGDQVQ